MHPLSIVSILFALTVTSWTKSVATVNHRSHADPRQRQDNEGVGGGAIRPRRHFYSSRSYNGGGYGGANAAGGYYDLSSDLVKRYNRFPYAAGYQAYPSPYSSYSSAGYNGAEHTGAGYNNAGHTNDGYSSGSSYARAPASGYSSNTPANTGSYHPSYIGQVPYPLNYGAVPSHQSSNYGSYGWKGASAYIQ